MATDFSGWAGQLLDHLPSGSISTGQAIAWLQSSSSLNQLNSCTHSGYAMSGGDIAPVLTSIESGLFSEMFIAWYFERESIRMVGAFDADWTEVRGEDQGSVRRVSKNENAKTLRLLHKDALDRIGDLCDWYQGYRKLGQASQVLYNLRAGSSQSALCAPPANLCSTYNPVWSNCGC